MRNLKKILAVICVVAMMASIAIVPALAAGFANEAQATTLNTLGVMAGMNLGDEVTRIQGLTFAIKAAGKDAAAQALTQAEVDAALANVVDAKDIPAWGQKYAAYAVTTAMTTGVDASIAPKIKFAPLQAISGDSFLVWTLKSMGYTTVGTANAWEVAVTDAKVLTLSQGYTVHGAAKLIRDDVAGILYGALDNGVCKDGKAFVDTLVAAGMFTQQQAFDAGLGAAPAPKALAVDSVVADNLKAVKIVFTVPVDKDTVDTTNISTTNGPAIANLYVSDDKTTVWAELGTASAQNGKITVKVKDVKDAAGNKITETSTDVYAKDLAVPTVSGVSVVDAKNLEISVSEPINYINPSNTVLSNIKIDGLNPIGTTTFDYVNNKIKVSLVNVLAAGTHNVEVKDMVDFSSLKAVTTTFSIAVASDTAAPSIASVTYKSNTVLEINFNETLSALGSIKIDGTDRTGVSVLDGKKVTVTLPAAAKLGIGAIVQVKVEYKDQKDVVGNKVADWTTFTFTVADDTTLPTATVAVGDANKITFSFSKAMSTVGKITMKDKDGKAYGPTIDASATGTWKDSNKTLELANTAVQLNNVDVNNYTFVLENFKDASIRENGMPKTELSITAKDTKTPTVTVTYLAVDEPSDNNKDTITFYFSEAMDSATAQNLSNYVRVSDSLNFAAITDVKVKEFASDGKSITFYYPSAGALIAGNTFRVLAIKDLAGNMIASTVIDKNTTTGMSVVGGGIKAIADNKIEVYFSNNIKTADPSAFKVQKNGADYSTFSAFEIKNDATGGPSAYKVTFTLVNALDTTSTAAYTLAGNVDNAVESIYGTKLTLAGFGAAKAITDAAAPYVKEVTADDGRIITVKFSECVTTADVNSLLSSLVVVDPDGNVIAVGAKLTGISFFNDDLTASAANFNKIQLQFASGEDGKVYKISVLSKAAITDISTANNIKGYAETAFTLKQ